LAYRERDALPYDPAAIQPDDAIMPDTTVYVDGVKGRLPDSVRGLLVGRRILHSGVACAELSVVVGVLDPADPTTPGYLAPVMDVLDEMDPVTTTTPSAEAWTEAGVLAGILARSQGLVGKRRRGERGRAVLQAGAGALAAARRADLPSAAAEQGAVLVSRNKRHIDLLLQRPGRSEGVSCTLDRGREVR
jgi:hypothetical protein